MQGKKSVGVRREYAKQKKQNASPERNEDDNVKGHKGWEEKGIEVSLSDCISI